MTAQATQLPPLDERLVVSLNVGGVKFDTTAATLLKGARQGSQVLLQVCKTLHAQQAQQQFSVHVLHGSISLDRNGAGARRGRCDVIDIKIVYTHVLDFLRDGTLYHVPQCHRQALIAEAKYLGLKQLEEKVGEQPQERDLLVALTQLEVNVSQSFSGMSDKLREMEGKVQSLELRLDFIRILAKGSASGMRLAGLKLPKTDLHNLDLKGIRFDRCNLSSACFRKAELDGCSFQVKPLALDPQSSRDDQGANLAGADFSSASISGTNFTGAELDACTNFEGVKWETDLCFTGKIVSVQLPPVDGEFFFLVQGAQAEDTESYKGGRGAILSGRLQLKGSSLLHILVGGKSKLNGRASGGGGGSFVVLGDDLLFAAGGGGGAGEQGDGTDASLTEDGDRGGGGAGWIEDSAEGARSFKNGGQGGGDTGGFGGGGACAGYGGSGGGRSGIAKSR
ncbi:hypothetical protein GUITHDRAFT_145612 [Guillardia theta CCMP2712]|uniref:Potassium channel tetramerisation-type BTB domain-containing protein n=1 Tax=Guillardia theta (strain CCMP2712) TaxID=905079 RepID=L1ILI7_GUITC|nr:hypothetical protein GUITHDRAFT_145612 [Guillardia theta CCMP2712]EKX36660.1 hypothetical protein GUITHDRAFT_145612 [Guillardia theta CCMP2712]|eukprot:XP_005823640.1 hypothetical protein GUITHDRAFT_145612 [Guillardia theta CCMP2712]